MPSTGAIITFVLSILLSTLYHAPLNSNTLFLTRSSEGGFQQAKNLLLITAHPDDEAMFFAPTILRLASRREIISLFHVCLSNGNADGLGELRKAELGHSLDILGVSRQNRWLIDHAYVWLE